MSPSCNAWFLASTHARTVSSGVKASTVGEEVGLDSLSLGLGADKDGVGSAMSGVGSSSQATSVARTRATTSARSRATSTSFPEKADDPKVPTPGAAENASAEICG